MNHEQARFHLLEVLDRASRHLPLVRRDQDLLSALRQAVAADEHLIDQVKVFLSSTKEGSRCAS